MFLMEGTESTRRRQPYSNSEGFLQVGSFQQPSRSQAVENLPCPLFNVEGQAGIPLLRATPASTRCF